MEHIATYSPEDDKIRIYPAHRLDAVDYQRVKGCGFSWAPKQECFYAVWSPRREDYYNRHIEAINAGIDAIKKAEGR